MGERRCPLIQFVGFFTGLNAADREGREIPWGWQRVVVGGALQEQHESKVRFEHPAET